MATKAVKTKRRFKRKNFGKKSFKYQSFRKRVRKIAKSVVTSKTQKKFIDYNIGGDITSAGSVTELSAFLVQGASVKTREENNCYLRKLILRFRLTAELNAFNWVRCFIVATRQNLSVSTVGDILKVQDLGSATVYPDQFVDDERFHVLYDKLMYVQYINATESIPDKVINVQYDPVKIYKKLKYSSTTGSADNIRFYWCCLSDSGASAHPNIKGTMRIQFVDFI